MGEPSFDLNKIIPLGERTNLIDIGKKTYRWPALKFLFKSKEEKNEIFATKGKEELLKRISELKPGDPLEEKITRYVNEILKPEEEIPSLNVVKDFYLLRDEFTEKIAKDSNHWLNDKHLEKLEYSEENSNLLLRYMTLDRHYDKFSDSPELQKNFSYLLEVLDFHETESKNIPSKIESTNKFLKNIDLLQKQSPEKRGALGKVLAHQKEKHELGASKILLTFILKYPDLEIFPKELDVAEFNANLPEEIVVWNRNLASYNVHQQLQSFSESIPTSDPTESEKTYPLTHKINNFNQNALNDYVEDIGQKYGKIFEQGIRREFPDTKFYYKSRLETLNSANKLIENLSRYQKLGLLDSFRDFYEKNLDKSLPEVMAQFNKEQWDEYKNHAKEMWPELGRAFENLEPRLKNGEIHYRQVKGYELPFQLIDLFQSENLREGNQGKELAAIFSGITDLKDLPARLNLSNQDLGLLSQYLRYGQTNQFLKVVLMRLEPERASSMDKETIKREQESFEAIDNKREVFENLGLAGYYDRQIKARLDQSEDFPEALSETARVVEQQSFEESLNGLLNQQKRYQAAGIRSRFDLALEEQLKDDKNEDKHLTAEVLQDTHQLLDEMFAGSYISYLSNSSGIPDAGLKQQIYDELMKVNGSENEIRETYDLIADHFPRLSEIYQKMVVPGKLEAAEYTQVVANHGFNIWEDIPGFETNLNKFLASKQTEENWGREGTILHGIVKEYLEKNEPDVLRGQLSIEDSVFFKKDRRDQFALLFPQIKERFSPLDENVIYDHLTQGTSDLPSKEEFEKRVKELAHLKRFSEEFLNNAYKDANPVVKQTFIAALAPYLIDCMDPASLHPNRALRLFGAYSTFLKKHPFYPPETVSEAIKQLLDKDASVKKVRPQEIVDQFAPPMLASSLMAFFSYDLEFSETQTQNINKNAYALAAKAEGKRFLESKGLAFTSLHEGAVQDVLGLFKPEQMNQQTWPYVMSVVTMALDLGIEYRPADVQYFIANDFRIIKDFSKKNQLLNHPEELKQDIVEKLKLRNPSNLLTRLQTNPVSVLQRVLTTAVGHLLPEKRKSENLERFSAALQRIGEPLQRSELIQGALETAGPATPFIRFFANMLNPASQNVDMLIDEIGLSINGDLRELRKAKETGEFSEKNLSFVSQWMIPRMAKQISEARLLAQGEQKELEEINPIQEFLAFQLPEMAEKLKWADYGYNTLVKVVPLAASLFESSLAQFGIKKMINFGLNKFVENEKVKASVGPEEKEIILGSTDALVGVAAPIVVAMLNRHDLTKYTALLKKMNEIVQADEPPDPIELNLISLEFIQALFTDIQQYRPIIIDALKQIAQSESTPLGESKMLV